MCHQKGIEVKPRRDLYVTLEAFLFGEVIRRGVNVLDNHKGATKEVLQMRLTSKG